MSKKNNVRCREKENDIHSSKISAYKKELLLPSKKKKKLLRLLFISLGSISLCVGVIGIFVPGIPTTPLILLTAWLFSKGSERLYRKLYTNKFLGPRIRNYKTQKGIPIKLKIRIIILMSVMIIFSSLVMLPSTSLRFAVMLAGIIGIIVVAFIVPTPKQKK